MSALATLIAIASCAREQQTVCDPPTPPYGIVAIVRDSITDEPLAFGAAGWTDGAGVHDTLQSYSFGGSAELYSTQNAPGTYRVVVRHSGYREWIGTVEATPTCGGSYGIARARMQRM
jgi:hypothetical protein